MTDKTIEDKKGIARAWFRELRDGMCAAFEFLEDTVDGPNEEVGDGMPGRFERTECCLLYTSPSPRDATLSRMPSSA